ncbi:MAG: hypothetical protein ABFD49_09100 [Armatimonadota bacterium]|nr:hypothetical protein [bacterium]
MGFTERAGLCVWIARVAGGAGWMVACMFVWTRMYAGGEVAGLYGMTADACGRGVVV